MTTGITSDCRNSQFQNDPLQRTPPLSDSEWQNVRNQSVPSLYELLDLAKEHNVSIIFDLKNERHNNSDAYFTVQTILASGIAQNLVSLTPEPFFQYAI